MTDAIMPDIRALNRHGRRGQAARSVIIPADVIKFWESKYGKITEVEIRREGEEIIISPRLYRPID